MLFLRQYGDIKLWGSKKGRMQKTRPNPREKNDRALKVRLVMIRQTCQAPHQTIKEREIRQVMPKLQDKAKRIFTLRDTYAHTVGYI